MNNKVGGFSFIFHIIFLITSSSTFL